MLYDQSPRCVLPYTEWRAAVPSPVNSQAQPITSTSSYVDLQTSQSKAVSAASSVESLLCLLPNGCILSGAKTTTSAEPKVALKGGKILLIGDQNNSVWSHSQLPILISGYRNFDYKKNSIINQRLI